MRPADRLVTALCFSAALFEALPSSAADLVIAVPNWPSAKATANILKVAISKELGLEAELRELGTLKAFVGLDAGSVDILPEVWRPNLDKLVEKYVDGKGTVVLGTGQVTAWQGLCATPAAGKTIASVLDLKDPAKTSALDTDGDGKGELWIGAPTWLSTDIERVRANGYGYASTLTLVEAEEEVAMAAVDAAVATDRPMVFACYAPHFVFDLHHVTRLAEPPYDEAGWRIVGAEDPSWIAKSSATVSWPSARFNVAYAAALPERRPDVARFLENVSFTTEEVTGMSYALEVERRDPAEFSKSWVRDHALRVDGWAKP